MYFHCLYSFVFVFVLVYLYNKFDFYLSTSLNCVCVCVCVHAICTLHVNGGYETKVFGGLLSQLIFDEWIWIYLKEKRALEYP